MKIHDIGRTVCSPSVFGFTGIFAKQATGTVIEGNEIYTIGRLRIGEGGCVDGIANIAGDHGIYTEFLRGTTTIKRNVFYDTNRGWCVQLHGNSSSEHYDLYHNTCHGKSPTGTPSGQLMHWGTFGTINTKNNIFSDPQTAPLTLFSLTCTAINYDYNLTDNADADMWVSTKPGCATDGGNNTKSGTLGFTSVGSNDFSLAATSNAINTGVALTGYSFNGSAPDKGAFETMSFASGSVEAGDANTIRTTWNNNTFPPLSTSGSSTFNTTGWTARVAAGARNVTAVTKVGDNQLYLTIDGAAVTAGQAVDFSCTTATTATDSAAIGGTLYQKMCLGITNQAVTNNTAGAPSHTFTQAAYEFHGLRGTEAAPVMKPDGVASTGAAENVSRMEVAVGGKIRVRFALTCTDADCPPTGFFPRYSRNAGGYSNVIPDAFGADNIAFCGTGPDPDIPNNGTATTEQLSTSGTFVAGAVVLTSNAIPTVDMAQNGKTELEYCVAFDTDATAGDTYDIRLYEQDGSALDAYTVTPRITLVGASGSSGFASLPQQPWGMIATPNPTQAQRLFPGLLVRVEGSSW